MKTGIKIGDKVRPRGNAVGTAWEIATVESLKNGMALLSYGEGFGKLWGPYPDWRSVLELDKVEHSHAA